MVDDGVDLGLRISLHMARNCTLGRFGSHARTGDDSGRLSLVCLRQSRLSMGGRRWLRALGLRDQLLLLKSFIPTSCFNLRNLLLDGRISPLERLDVCLDIMLAKASVESRDKLWYQVRVLRGFRHSWQTWAGGLPLPRAGRNIAIRETGFAVCLSLQVTLHFLLE